MRQQTISFILLLALLLGVALTSQQPPASAASTWTTAERLSSEEAVTSFFPDTVIDSAGVAHVVWYDSDFITSQVFYTNNRGGTWRTPMKVFTGYPTVDRPRLSTVTVNGQIRVAIAARASLKAAPEALATARVAYRQSIDGGVTWQAQETATNHLSYEPDMVLDDTGQAHIAYANVNDQGVFSIYYATRANGTWGGQTRLVVANRHYYNYASIGYTRVNGELSLHLMFMANRDSTEVSKTVYYARKTGSSAWSAPIIFDQEADFPDIETDPLQGTVYVTWQSVDGGLYDTFFAVSTTNGDSWSKMNLLQRSGTDTHPGIGRTPTNELAVLWDTSFGNEDGEIDARVFELGAWGTTTRISPAAKLSKEPEVAGGPQGFIAVWHDGRNRAQTTQIFYSTYAVASGPSVQPVIEGDAVLTGKTANLSVALTNQKNSPTEVRYRWGAAPTDANAWVAIPATNALSIAGPSPLGSATCTPQKLYVQARNASITGSIINTDAIVIDAGVQASVTIRGPLTSHKRMPQAEGFPIAGDARFIRTPQVAFKVADEPTGCAGVASFVADDGQLYSGPTDLNQHQYLTLNTSVWSVEGNNPDGSPNYAEHEETVSVTVTDRVNDTAPNTHVFSSVLIYDDDPPVLVSSAGLTATNSDGMSPLATISFPDVVITDNVYDQHVSDPQKAYWGMWVLVSNTDLGTPTAMQFAQHNAQVYAIEEGRTSAQIYLNRGGIDNNPGRDPGTRYIYIRFLDGAGNFTAGMAKLELELKQGYASNTYFMPALYR